MTSELLNRFNIGNPISNQECRELSKFFTQLAESLMLMGPHYHLSWWAVAQNRNAVNGYILARKLDRKRRTK